jgi:hypothetical protein
MDASMAQQHASSPEVIYNVLTTDSTFMELVGSRVFKAGNTALDAISIVTPGADLPAIKSTTGLEVVIHDVSDLGRRQYVTSEIDITTTWRVFLLAWSGATGGTLNSAATRIMELFTNATTIETSPTPDGLGSIAQLLVLIPSDSVVLGPQSLEEE